MNTVDIITSALHIALNRKDYCVLDRGEADHLIECIRAGRFDTDGKDWALCVLEDAEEELGYDATIAMGSVGSIPV